MLLRSTLVAVLALPTLISGRLVRGPDARNFKSLPRAASGDALTRRTPGKLRVVENSGVCETTPGVYQASGYGDLKGGDKSIWFWFFASRNDPDNAPLITWFNGGPGASSMMGLFQELGPCRINNQSTGVDLNPTSWNEYANVLFIDQPAGTGFSHGTENVYTSQAAAIDIWEFLQIWFADSRFSKYSERHFGIWTESYGGHYGPAFAAYFLQQNNGIQNGTVKGQIINLKTLGLGNPYLDLLTLYPGYIEYANSNPYHPLVNSSVISAANSSWTQPGGCRDQIIECNDGGSDVVCSTAKNWCDSEIFDLLAGNWDYYYVPLEYPDPYPPALEPYLQSSAVTSRIGSDSGVIWMEENLEVYFQFLASGDGARSSRPDLEMVINSGVRTIVYDGDADFICNYKSIEAMVDSLNTKFSAEYASQNFTTYAVNGKPAGLYKNAGSFSYLRVYGAGHEVPAYLWRDVPRGAAALQMFAQIMSDHQLSST